MRHLQNLLEQLGIINNDTATKPLLGDIEQGILPTPIQPVKASFIEVCNSLRSLIFSEENTPPVMLAAFLSVMGVGLNIFAPYTLEKTMEALQDPESDIITPVLIMGIAFMLNQYIPMNRSIILAPVSSRVTKKLVMQLVDKFLKYTSLESHISTPEADNNFLLMKSLAVSQIMTPLLTQIMPILLEMCIATIVLSSKFGCKMGVNLAVLLIVLIGYSTWMSPSIVMAGDSSRQAGMKSWNKMLEAVRFFELIHDLGSLDYIIDLLNGRMSEFAEIDVNLQTMRSNVDTGLILLARVIVTISLIQMDRKDLTRQEAIVLITYLQQLISQLTSLGQATNQVLSAYPDLALVIGKLQQTPEGTDLFPNDKLVIENQPPTIQFMNILFSYQLPTGTPVQVLNKASFTIPGGQTVALFAPSGAGKSTLFNLLFRYYELQSGTIMIDGIDISKVSRESLRGHIGIVAQKSNLLGGTIRENIAFGAEKPDKVTNYEIMQMAIKAGLADFINGLENGLDTDVGEEGKSLSGGQKQKVAILRTLMKRTPILLLDEVTSGLDIQSATKLLRNLRDMQGVTTVMITHSMTEMERHCDTIIVLDKGEAVAQGTHGELLESCSLYKEKWNEYKQNPEVAEQPLTSPSQTSLQEPGRRLGISAGD